MTESRQGPTTIHFIVPSADGSSLLVQAPADPLALELPQRIVQFGDEDTLEPALAAAVDLLGPAAAVLRIAPLSEVDWDHGVDAMLLEAEGIPPAATPAGHAWQPIASLAPERLAAEPPRPALARWLEEHGRDAPNPKRPVWS